MPYSYSIHVLTNYQLRQVLQKPDASGHLLKWVIKLSQFDIKFMPRPTIKGQALADFIDEFTTPEDKRPEEAPTITTAKVPNWGLYMDGSSNEGGLETGLILVSLEGHRMNCALRFGFKASNNETEYEALIARLNLAKEMKVESLEIYSDSQLIVCQVTNKYQTRGEKMVAYLQKAKDLLSTFSSYTIQQVLRAQNAQVDALAWLASTKDAELLEVIPIEFLNELSVHPADQS